jgi:hypothetical protein
LESIVKDRENAATHRFSSHDSVVKQKNAILLPREYGHIPKSEVITIILIIIMEDAMIFRKLTISLMTIFAGFVLAGCGGGGGGGGDVVGGTDFDISGTITGGSTGTYASWYTSKGSPTNYYVQAVITDDSTMNTLLCTVSDKSVLGSDGSFSITLESVPATYLSTFVAPTGLTATPNNRKDIDSAYDVDIWIINPSTTPPTKVGSLFYQTSYAGTALPNKNPKLMYFSDSASLTGTVVDGSVNWTCNISLVAGWNWKIDYQSSATAGTVTATTIQPTSGVNWYIR